MNKKDQDEIKKVILKHRRDGADKKSVAILGGIDRKTLYNWLDEDSTFSTQFSQAWKQYMMGLVRKQKEKDPWKLLTNDFNKRFKEKKEEDKSITNILMVNDGQLAEHIVGLFGQPQLRGDTSEAEVIKSGPEDGTDKPGTTSENK